MIDTRLAGGGSDGLIEGTVSRIDPSILNGTVTVDVALKDALPPVLRPDLSVDGTIQLEKLDDVVYVGRPVFGQQDSNGAALQARAGRKVRAEGQGDVRP